MTMEALPTEMTKLDLVSKCLEFNQALAALGQTISLSINIGSIFIFNLETRVKATTLDTVKPEASLDTRRQNTSPPWTRKKLSPSTIKRNNKRREDFFKRKVTPPHNPSRPNLPPTNIPPPTFPPTNHPPPNFPLAKPSPSPPCPSLTKASPPPPTPPPSKP